MGSVYLRGKSWTIQYKEPDGSWTRDTVGRRGIITKTVADKILAETERKIKLGQYDMLEAKIPTLNEFSPVYIAHQRDVKQIRSHERTKQALAHFARFFGDKPLNRITAEDVDIYKQRRLSEGMKPGTVARDLTSVRHLFNQARKWKKFFGENPVSASGLPEVHDLKERVLSVEEQRRLEGEIAPQYRDIILFALNTGMRLGEIMGLKWEWVNLDESVITLSQTHTKARRARKVPINQVSKRVLRERKLKAGGGAELVFPDNTRYGLRARVQRAFKEACRRAGITDMRFHDLRHTVGTRLGESGVPIQTISGLLGHTTIRMTERYVHPGESITRAMDILADISDSVTHKSTHIAVNESGDTLVTP